MRFHFPQNAYLTVVNNVPHRNEEFCVEENDGYIIVNVFAENSADCCLLPLFAVIDVHGGKVSVFGKLTLTRWDDDCDVAYTLYAQPYYTPPTAIAQAEHRYGNGVFTATVYNDGTTHLLMETSDKTARFDLPEISNPDIRFQPTNLGFLTVLTAKNGGEEYLLLLLYNGVFNKIFETSAEKITYSPRSFIVTENLRDMLGRRRISAYSFSGTDLNPPETTFDYAREKIYPEVLTPYLLLEAVRAGDMDITRAYLTEDLFSERHNLPAYFGDFTAAVSPRYKRFKNKTDLLSVALLYKENAAVVRPRVFKFKLLNGKICDISSD